MPKQVQVRTAGLSTVNLSDLKSKLKEPISGTSYRFLLAAIACALDAEAVGLGDWVSIGRNQAGDAFLLTYHRAGGKLYASGASLAELASECSTFLEPSEMV